MRILKFYVVDRDMYISCYSCMNRMLKGVNLCCFHPKLFNENSASEVFKIMCIPFFK